MVQFSHLLLVALSTTTALANPISLNANTDVELDVVVEQALDEIANSTSTPTTHALEARGRKVYFNTFTHPGCKGGNTVHQIYNEGECHRFKTGYQAAQSFFVNNLSSGCKLRVGSLTNCDTNTGYFPEVGKCYSIASAKEFLKSYWVYCGA